MEEENESGPVENGLYDDQGIMYPWVRRLVEEHAELSGRIAKLADYMKGGEFPYVKAEQRLAMQWQLQEMQGYRMALEKRLALLGIAGGDR
jgi:hypothetical protein